MPFGASRRRIPAIEKGVNGDRDALGSQRLGRGRHVILVRMHAARRHQAHDVGRTAGNPERIDEIAERPPFGQRPVGHRGVDLGQILQDDPAGADRHVPDLGVAHLTARQADEMLRRFAQRVGAGCRQPVPDRRFRPGDGVVFRFGAMPPAVQDAQHNGAARIGMVRGGIGGHGRMGWKGGGSISGMLDGGGQLATGPADAIQTMRRAEATNTGVSIRRVWRNLPGKGKCKVRRTSKAAAQQVRRRTRIGRNCRYSPIGLCRASAPRPIKKFRDKRQAAAGQRRLPVAPDEGAVSRARSSIG